jgi:hypothetical protein
MKPNLSPNDCKKNFKVSTGYVTAHLKKKELLFPTYRIIVLKNIQNLQELVSKHLLIGVTKFYLL